MIHTSDRPAMLMRELRARIVEISESGCLIETDRPLGVATVGTLQLHLGDTDCRDDFEVMDCKPLARARSLYLAEVRFLWTTPRLAGTIRHAVAVHAAELAPVATTYVM